MRQIFCGLVASLMATAPALAADAVDWRAAADQDLKAFHDLLRENHPAQIVDKDSATFRGWIETGYRQSRAYLPQVKDARGYYFLLKRYAGGFRDGHIAFGPDPAKLQIDTVAWPGFATSWRDGRYVVDQAVAGGPAKGAIVISCDGRPIEEVARERLDRFEGNLQLDAGRYRSAKSLLWDRGNPFLKPLRACVFGEDGRQKSVRLDYRPADKAETDKAGDAASGYARPPLDLIAVGPGRWRIGMPSMGDNQDWKGFFGKIDAALSDLRQAQLIVVDLRGNGGGSSSYGDMLAERLWGKPLVDARRPELGPVIYRVSAVNRKFLGELYGRLEADPLYASEMPELRRGLAAYDEAARKGEAMVTMPEDAKPKPSAAPGDNPLKAKVVLLTDYACASACLDVMDLFLAMPNVVQAGTTSNADTIFMELTWTGLPSGQAKAYFAHKVWIARPRGSNIPYRPSPELTYRGTVADAAAWNAWIDRTFPAGG